MAQTYEMNLVGLVEKFHSEEKCRAYLEALRWPGGPRCPRCVEKGASHTVSRIHDRDQFDCDACRYQFSATSGTIFHDTKLPLWKWFLAVYMIVESKKGISANQLKRTLDVSYRTAWYLCHRIRHALQVKDAPRLTGVVEVDETTIGGKVTLAPQKPGKRGRRGRGSAFTNKTWIVGAVSRDGDIRLRVIGGRTAPEIRSFVRDTIDPKANRLITDEYQAYDWIGMEHMHMRRRRLKHSAGEYARGDDHTNTIEGAWSLFKRSIVGAFHKVSEKHLDAYLDEFEFRYNNRNNAYIFRDSMKALLRSGNLEYAELVADAD